MKEKLREELYNYCSIMIPHFFAREMIALDKIGEWRCPLAMADSSLYNDMQDCVDDFCYDNEIDQEKEEVDIEEIFLPS